MIWLDYIVLAGCVVIAALTGIIWARWTHRARIMRAGTARAQEVLARSTLRPRTGHVEPHGRYRNGRGGT